MTRTGRGVLGVAAEALGFLAAFARRFGAADAARAVARRARFLRLNPDRAGRDALGAQRLTLSPGVTFAIEPRVEAVFRNFVDLDAEAWREMDGFLALMAGRTRLVDVGAHYGIFSLAFTTRPGTAALAIEPSPANLDMLRRHAALNPGHDIRPRPVALGAQEGTLPMRADAWHFTAAPSGGDPHDGPLTEVRMRTLDALLVEEGFVPDTVKIDVEGFELDVLSGAQDTLRRHHPLLFLESHPALMRALGREPRAVAELLGGLGYRVQDARGALVGDPRPLLDGPIRRLIWRWTG